jgi:hypothetical protein
VPAELRIHGAEVRQATAYEIVDDPIVEVSDLNSGDVMQIKQRQLSNSEPWKFPAASVSAVEVQLQT